VGIVRSDVGDGTSLRRWAVMLDGELAFYVEGHNFANGPRVIVVNSRGRVIAFKRPRRKTGR